MKDSALFVVRLYLTDSALSAKPLVISGIRRTVWILSAWSKDYCRAKRRWEFIWFCSSYGRHWIVYQKQGVSHLTPCWKTMLRNMSLQIWGYLLSYYVKTTPENQQTCELGTNGKSTLPFLYWGTTDDYLYKKYNLCSTIVYIFFTNRESCHIPHLYMKRECLPDPGFNSLWTALVLCICKNIKDTPNPNKLKTQNKVWLKERLFNLSINGNTLGLIETKKMRCLRKWCIQLIEVKQSPFVLQSAKPLLEWAEGILFRPLREDQK